MMDKGFLFEEEIIRKLLEIISSSKSTSSQDAKPLRAVGYVRVSSQMQLEGSSLEDQEERIRAYIKSENWQEVAILKDPAQSGRTPKRHTFRWLKRLIRRREVDVVVIDRLDRLSRNFPALLNFVKMCKDHNVKLVSLRENIDLHDPLGKLILYILGILAEFFSNALSEEIRIKCHMDAQRGYLSGAFRFGYCKGNCSSCTDPNGPGYCPRYGGPDIGDGKVRVPHPIESHAVRLMFSWYASGKYSDADIARRLNTEVFTLPDGTKVRFRTKGKPGAYPPGPFDKDAVRAILINPIYIGVVTYAGSDKNGRKRRKPIALYPGKHQPLVDPETFWKAQLIRKNRYHRSTSLKHPARTYPLSGLVFCSHRHSPMRGISSNGGRNRYYVDKLCRQKRNERHQPNVKAEPLEAQVEEIVGKIKLPKAWKERILAYIYHSEGMAHLERKRAALFHHLEAAKELYRQGLCSRQELEEIRREIQRKLTTLLPTQTPVAQKALSLLDDMSLLLSRLTDEEKNLLYRQMIAAIFVQGDCIKAIEAYPPFVPLSPHFVAIGTVKPLL
ncbi:MAG: hypothetical protein DRN95_08175 [Candidatus Hydrothermarchaeota archaeon]|nr:MAG: hypothetical protein DRN95_08175 [Candidatus Hydrothermarchaeota archaeon]